MPQLDAELEALADLREDARERAAAVEFVAAVATGHAADQIVKHAEREKVDLIVMGTHGRTGLAHAVRGSVAEAVMRHAPSLVLTIRRKAELPLDVEESEPAEPPPAVRPDGVPPGQCLVCAQPSPDPVCDACKARIRAEAFLHLHEEERAGRK